MAIIEGVKARTIERTSWDGAVIIAISAIALMATPIIKWVAIAGLAYGIFSIYKKED